MKHLVSPSKLDTLLASLIKKSNSQAAIDDRRQTTTPLAPKALNVQITWAGDTKEKAKEKKKKEEGKWKATARLEMKKALTRDANRQ